jgi:hypothetical protein
MSDELDPQLLDIFASSHQTLPSKEFMEAFHARLQRAQRMRALRRIALIVVLVVVAARIAPSVLDHTAAAASAIVEYSKPDGALIVSPFGWAVSMLIAFAVLWRAGALRRR